MNKIPQFMSGVYLTGHGGLDKLVFKEDIPVPIPKSGEVLIQVKGAGINNTDINTRLGWYSKKITSETNTVEIESENGSWNGIPISFPRIQGGDICGNIIQVGEGVDSTRVGERILVRSMQNSLHLKIPGQCKLLVPSLMEGLLNFVLLNPMSHFLLTVIGQI
jgi:NADPH:quinone reductase-like Zn-dependent oxidoreductase